MMQHNLKKGYDIRLAGTAQKNVVDLEGATEFAIKPTDFRGIKPRLVVAEGDSVKIGTELFYDKIHPEVKFVSPACGKITAINRGERRAIMEVVIESDGSDEAVSFEKLSSAQIAAMDRAKLAGQLLEGGVWPLLRQRPYSNLADPNVVPRDIFVGAFTTAPLAVDYDVVLDGEEEYFAAGIEALKKLTDGKVYVSVNGKGGKVADMASRLSGVEVHGFNGPHPAANVSVHIHHIKPINTGDHVWYLYAPDVVNIGKFLVNGSFPVERVVAVAGSSVNESRRMYFRTRLGVAVTKLTGDEHLKNEAVRYISGDVLSGKKLLEKGYLGFYDNLLTVIPEGRKREFLGWLGLGAKEESYSRTFLSSLFGPKEYVKDTRVNGGTRAFIQTGEYENVVPMDIFPSHLVKSILAEDIEEMIGLGILEVDEEDFALCSYICPSKIDFGAHIRAGLDLLEREG